MARLNGAANLSEDCYTAGVTVGSLKARHHHEEAKEEQTRKAHVRARRSRRLVAAADRRLALAAS